MQNLFDPEIDRFRLRSPEVLARYGNYGDKHNGCFVFGVGGPERDVGGLFIIASRGSGWDHLSVSAKDRCPTWEEMELVRKLFFGKNSTAMQLHMPESLHINHHPFCLHIWKPIRKRIPLPPTQFVGPTE